MGAQIRNRVFAPSACSVGRICMFSSNLSSPNHNVTMACGRFCFGNLDLVLLFSIGFGYDTLSPTDPDVAQDIQQFSDAVACMFGADGFVLAVIYAICERLTWNREKDVRSLTFFVSAASPGALAEVSLLIQNDDARDRSDIGSEPFFT